MVAVMLVIGLANILWAERLMYNDGLGWDGATYAAWTKDFHRSILVERVSEYYVGRLLPSAVVHYGMRLLGVPRTNANIIAAFDVYNLALLLLAVWVWGLIAERLQISDRGKWFGFCALFLNFAILKNNFYHSVLTDTTAFVLGILMFYFYLADRPLGLILVMFFGGFVWPTLPPMAALLYVFPRTAQPRLLARRSPAGVRWNSVVAGLVTAGFLAGIVVLLGPLQDKLRGFYRALRIDPTLLYASVAGSLLYLFFSLRAAADDDALFRVKSYLAQIRWKRAAAAVAVLALLKLTLRLLANGQRPWVGFKGFVGYTFASSLTEPLIFLVAHAVYYGPAILLVILLWRSVCDELNGFGLGLRLLVILNVALALNPQSRYGINVVVIFIALAVRLVDRFGLKNAHVVGWAALCLVGSKVWYVMNTGPQTDDGSARALLSFPMQHYFMNAGPWMSREMYFVQGAAVLLIGTALFVVLSRTARIADRPIANAL